jgi:sterol desaturase/sphingolipid hydroxylase (fatty acid hydroxylase superfamily)
MISTNSIKNYFIVNSFLCILGVLQYYSILQLDFFLGLLLIFTIRNYLLVQFIDYGTKSKPKIYNEAVIEDYKYEFHVNVITTTTVETITHILVKKIIYTHSFSFTEIVYFIPVSFLFEVIFDFFHYFSHRMIHHKYFYKLFHKKHHKFNHPVSITTFYQDPIDLIITNSIPTIITILLLPNITYSQFNFIIIYKNFIEISGHSGKILYPTASFSQFMWLPKLLHIELYSEDHDIHHSINNCNYSKRFSLWDKIFRTYTSSKK